MLHRRWREAMVVAVVGSAVLGGCSDGNEPSTLPDVTPKTSDSAEPTSSPETAEPTPSTDPTTALEAEVEDFIRTYEATVDESWHSDDALDQRRAMFADECEVCFDGYEMVRNARSKGLTLRAEPSQILEVEVIEADHERATALVMSDVYAGELVDRDGEVVETFPATPGIQVLYDFFRPEGGNWLVIRIQVL